MYHERRLAPIGNTFVTDCALPHAVPVADADRAGESPRGRPPSRPRVRCPRSRSFSGYVPHELLGDGSLAIGQGGSLDVGDVGAASVAWPDTDEEQLLPVWSPSSSPARSGHQGCASASEVAGGPERTRADALGLSQSATSWPDADTDPEYVSTLANSVASTVAPVDFLSSSSRNAVSECTAPSGKAKVRLQTLDHIATRNLASSAPPASPPLIGTWSAHATPPVDALPATSAVHGATTPRVATRRPHEKMTWNGGGASELSTAEAEVGVGRQTTDAASIDGDGRVATNEGATSRASSEAWQDTDDEEWLPVWSPSSGPPQRGQQGAGSASHGTSVSAGPWPGAESECKYGSERGGRVANTATAAWKVVVVASPTSPPLICIGRAHGIPPFYAFPATSAGQGAATARVDTRRLGETTTFGEGCASACFGADSGTGSDGVDNCQDRVSAGSKPFAKPGGVDVGAASVAWPDTDEEEWLPVWSPSSSPARRSHQGCASASEVAGGQERTRADPHGLSQSATSWQDADTDPEYVSTLANSVASTAVSVDCLSSSSRNAMSECTAPSGKAKVRLHTPDHIAMRTLASSAPPASPPLIGTWSAHAIPPVDTLPATSAAHGATTPRVATRRPHEQITWSEGGASEFSTDAASIDGDGRISTNEGASSRASSEAWHDTDDEEWLPVWSPSCPPQRGQQGAGWTSHGTSESTSAWPGSESECKYGSERGGRVADTATSAWKVVVVAPPTSPPLICIGRAHEIPPVYAFPATSAGQGAGTARVDTRRLGESTTCSEGGASACSRADSGTGNDGVDDLQDRLSAGSKPLAKPDGADGRNPSESMPTLRSGLGSGVSGLGGLTRAAGIARRRPTDRAQHPDARRERCSAEAPPARPAPGPALAAAVRTGITTLMLRNLPPGLTQMELLEELDRSGFGQLCDFCYLPESFEKGTNVNKTYAFVNFTSATAASALARAWHGRQVFGSSGDRPALNISASQLQGLEANLGKWCAKRLDRIRDPRHRPFVRGGAAPPSAPDGALEAPPEALGNRDHEAGGGGRSFSVATSAAPSRPRRPRAGL